MKNLLQMDFKASSDSQTSERVNENLHLTKKKAVKIFNSLNFFKVLCVITFLHFWFSFHEMRCQMNTLLLVLVLFVLFYWCFFMNITFIALDAINRRILQIIIHDWWFQHSRSILNSSSSNRLKNSSTFLYKMCSIIVPSCFCCFFHSFSFINEKRCQSDIWVFRK